MAASKLKNRRRFITRDVRLDIPEDQEFTISPLDDTTSQQDCHSPYSFTADTSLYDRTWPRRTWRPASDFAKPIGLHQNSVVSSTLTLPRFHHHGAHESQPALTRSGHCSGLQPQPPGDWQHGNGNASPTSSPDNRWRFRSLSDVVSSTCLSATSSPSETVSEPCFKTNCHDSAVYDAGSLSSRNSNVSSPRDLSSTTLALGSIPELIDDDDDDDDRSISGLEAKRRSRSLNESSSYYRPFFNQLRSSRSPQPGSVLHRALTWEMAGKSQPFRVTVSPMISDPKGQECAFRRNASTGKLHTIQPQLGFDPSNVRSSSSIWKSVDPSTKTWTTHGAGEAVNTSSNWKSVDPATKSWTKHGEGETVNTNSVWKSVDPSTKTWTKLEEGVAVIHQHKAIRLSPLSTSFKDSRDELKTEQTTWNSINAGNQSDQAREMTYKNLSNGYDVERLDQNVAGGDYNGFRATEFRTTARISPVKASRSFSGSTQSRKETENTVVNPSNTFRDSHWDDLDSPKDFLRVPLAEKTLNGDLCRDNNNSNASSYDAFPDQSISTSRKPFRSKSLKLLSSEATSFTLGKDSGFLRPLSDWKTDPISLSTPNSPLSHLAEVETAPEQSVTHSLAQPCMSMIALNTEREEHNLRTNSLTRSATSLLGNAAPQKSLSTWGPFIVRDLRKVVMKPLATTSISGQIKPDGIKPFGSNFVVRRITNLAKNPFNTISLIGEHKNGGIKPALSLPTTNTIIDEIPAFVKPLRPAQFEKEDHAGRNPSLIRLEREKSQQDSIEMAFPYDSHDTCARDKNHVPWSDVPAWEGTQNTNLDELCSPYNCDSLTSSKDTGYGRSASESSPSVTSERLTIHLAEPRETSLVDEDRVADRWKDDSSMPLARNSHRTSGEPCSRHIRVFLKSSTQLQDEAYASHVDKAVTKADAGSQNIDTDWKKEVSKIQLDKSPSGDRWVEVGNEMDAKAKDSVKVKDSAKANDSAKVKDSAKAKDSASVAAESSPKATHPEFWPQKASVNKSPPLLRNVESSFKDQQKQVEETSPIDWDLNVLSTARPVAASSCHIEMKSTEAGMKKPFEIVKKKLIIPEAMSWFSSREDKSNPRLTQDITSQKVKDPHTRKGQDVHGFRSEEKQSDGVKIFSTVHKDTEVSHKSVLETDAMEHNINRSVEEGTIPYIVNVPCPTDVTTFYDRAVQPKKSILENISIIPSNQALTVDTGISICEGVSRNSDNTNNNDSAANLTGISERGFEKSADVFNEDDIYRQADDVLCFLDSWTDAVEGGKKGEATAENFLSNGRASLVNSAPQASSPIFEDEEAKEFQTNMDCSIMTELDQAIERLTATRTMQTKAPPTGLQASTKTTNGPESVEGSKAPWEDISRKLTQAFSDQVNRKIPACTKVPPVQDKVRVAVSTTLNYFEQKPSISFSSFQSSCKPIAPIQVLRLSQNDVEGRMGATDKRNRWTVLASEDSFNRPDSPLFRKTLPLPKDSVIMRHRLHQKELGCSGTVGGGSLSSSESSDDESPVPRVAPRRTRKSRSASVDKGVAGVEEEATEEDNDKNGEGDSIASSTTSLRPLSLDSSFLSEDNM